jgi:hypothetical protein
LFAIDKFVFKRQNTSHFNRIYFETVYGMMTNGLYGPMINRLYSEKWINVQAVQTYYARFLKGALIEIQIAFLILHRQAF